MLQNLEVGKFYEVTLKRARKSSHFGMVQSYAGEVLDNAGASKDNVLPLCVYEVNGEVLPLNQSGYIVAVDKNQIIQVQEVAALSLEHTM